MRVFDVRGESGVVPSEALRGTPRPCRNDDDEDVWLPVSSQALIY